MLAGCVLAAGLLTTFAVRAVDNIGVFELEQNADMITTQAQNLPGDDWGITDGDAIDGTGNNCIDPLDNTCGYVAGPPADSSDHPHPGVDGHTGGNSVRHVWLSDFNNPDDIFDKGGSKDDEDISSWRFKLATPSSDKTDMGQGAVAVYLYDGDEYDWIKKDDLLTYFTANLFADNGVAKIGIWFVKQRLAKSTDGSGIFNEVDEDGTVLGPATHELGDITANMEFVGGGGIPIVSIYMWVGENPPLVGGKSVYCLANSNDISGGSEPDYCKPVTSPGNGTVAFVAKAEARCNSTGSEVFSPFACATTNVSATESIDSWGYTGKSNAQPDPDPTPRPPGTDGIQFNDHVPTTVFEGGINFSAVGLEGCYSTVVFNTRSSGSSVRSIFEDLMMGELDFCSIKVTKDGDELAKVGDEAKYTITIENDGVLGLFAQSITDVGDGWSGLGDLLNSANYDTSDCGNAPGAPLAATDSCTITASYMVQEGDPNPLENEVTAVYRPVFLGGTAFLGQAVSDSDDHSLPLFEPDFTLTKLCPEGVDEQNPWIVGEERSFRFNITNTSDANSPDLMLSSLTDAVLGDAVVKAAAEAQGADVLIADESVDFTVAYTPDADDAAAGAIDNSITAVYGIASVGEASFENTVEKTSDVSCPVIKRDSRLVTEVHADIGAADSPHTDVTGGQVDVMTFVHDFAKVTDDSGLGNTMIPSGKVRFQLYSSTDCADISELTELRDVDNVLIESYPLELDLDAQGEVETTPFKIPSATRAWKATYLGDGNFYGDDVAEPVCEALTGQAIPSTTVTFIHAGDPDPTHTEGTPDIQGNTVQVGTTIHDMAKVSPQDTGPVPEGTVLFGRFASIADCEGALAETPVGPGPVNTQQASLSGGLAETPLAYQVEPLPAGDTGGNLAYLASYLGDDDPDIYLSSTGTCEPLYIELNPSSVVTQVHDASHTVVSYDVTSTEVPIGTVIHDWAEVTGGGTAGGLGIDPTGDVEFSVWTGLVCEGEAMAIFNVALADDVTDDGVAYAETTDVGYSIELQSGDEYSFKARYLGLDGTYAAAGDSRCEPVKAEIAEQQGCTPGYWKVPQHHDSWVGYTTDQKLNSVFTFPAGGGPVASLANDTMLQALNYMGGTGAGGAAQILLRAAVASVLNAAHPDVSFPLDLGDIISDVNAALLSGDRATMLALATVLDDANNGIINNEGTHDCPLN
ncbi:hypothetical protein GCM10011348_16140 [Marinobacterium nitratireducens]|uniref:DUF11 domain-containing protein n=1 Tax=Marinobacterium nitratireducens TaxID=518897 RepID=A0A918DRJ8_9GAMM|nr:hypothetical protein GCM10011348_16140 [Marinobacterium nitratireducens]